MKTRILILLMLFMLLVSVAIVGWHLGATGVSDVYAVVLLTPLILAAVAAYALHFPTLQEMLMPARKAKTLNDLNAETVGSKYLDLGVEVLTREQFAYVVQETFKSAITVLRQQIEDGTMPERITWREADQFFGAVLGNVVSMDKGAENEPKASGA